MPHLTILRVCHDSDISDRVAVHSDAAFDFDLRLSVGVVADRCPPLTLAFEKLDAPDPANDGLWKGDRQDFFLEQCRYSESVFLLFDLLPLITADRQDDALDSNQFLVTLVLRDERFCYDTGDFWVILG